MKQKACEFLDRHRSNSHPMGWRSNPGDMFGLFIFNGLRVISSGHAEMNRPEEIMKWEHVSVSRADGKIPTWTQMCLVKDLFWEAEETVLQFHPKKIKYVNISTNCLHIWKPSYEVPLPPDECV